ncbi:uncharacterized protein LOC128881398 [Hylaeus volcanicus]|uniref:uncharacterized protein LOC128881398 n=1 Tax=Hylaeus volcanicus TaxID=313075 RepID=UPI0023B7D699|nr:uncharacterized protein LOC128881398 [Hylaeus volcanicus]
MNIEQYYDKKSDGSYVIHFPNDKGISLRELDQIFSAYGFVLSLDNRRNTHGLCFIRYGNLEEVKLCIEGLKNHKFIRILPHKNKILKQQPAKKTIHKQNKERNDQNHSVCESNKQLQYGNEHKFRNKMEHKEGSSTTDSSDISISSMRSIVNSKCSHKYALSRNHKVSKGVESYEEDEIPQLICNNQKHTTYNNEGFLSNNETTIPAQEVVVANIHPNLGIHYILHLFEKYNPISVSLMLMIPKTSIRYCHVYFKSNEEALATEKEFDRKVLLGKNLIVLRAQKLLLESLVM